MTIAAPSFFRKGIAALGYAFFGCLAGLGLSTLEYLTISFASNTAGLFFFAHPYLFQAANISFLLWPVVGGLSGLACWAFHATIPRWVFLLGYPFVGLCLGVTLYSGIIALIQFFDITMITTTVAVVGLFLPVLGMCFGFIGGLKCFLRTR